MAKEPNAVLATYEEAAQKLRDLAVAEEELGNYNDAARLRREASELEEWLNKGKPTPCPINLAAEGILVEEAQQPAAVTEETLVELVPPAEIEITEPVPGPFPEEVTVEVEVTPEEAPGEEHPLGEEEPLQLDPKQVEEILELRQNGRFNEALGQCQRLLASYSRGTREYEHIDRLRQETEWERQQQIEKILAEGDRACEEGNYQEAREQYSRVLEIDPDNSTARKALLEIDGRLSDQQINAQRQALIRGLREPRDVRALGDAVYYAEALEAEGKADAEILELLPSARERFDRMRKEMGQTTTLMRIGTLEERINAANELRDLITKGHTEIFDQTTHQYLPADRALREAEESVLQASADLAQSQINLARDSLPKRPRVAKVRLEELLKRPLHDEHKNFVERVLTQEVEPLVENLERAENLMNEARRTDDPLERFHRLLEAKAIFPHLEGLSEQLEAAREMALKALTGRVERELDEAEALLKQADVDDEEKAKEDYAAARDRVSTALELCNQWPEEGLPDELVNLRRGCEDVRSRIGDAETLRRDFDRQVQKIRKWVVDPNRREAGLRLFDELRRDRNYARFDSLLRDFDIELLNLRGVEEQVSQLDDAIDTGKWLDATQIAERILESGKAGDLSAHVRERRNQAKAHLLIGEARMHLLEQNVPEAQRCLRQAATLYPQVREESAPVYEEIDKEIQEAEKNDPPMRRIYQDALRQWNGASLQKKLEILKKMRHISGEKDFSEELGLPPFQISSITYEARQQLREWEEELRDELLPRILEYAQKNRSAV